MPVSEALPIHRATKIEIETIINAVSVPAGGNTGFVSAGHKGETYTVFAVMIDQQPWTATSRTPFGTGMLTGVLFPMRNRVTTTFLNNSTPALSLYVGLTGFTGSLVDSPSSIDEALRIAVGHSAIGIQIANESASTATVTVRVLRIWR